MILNCPCCGPRNLLEFRYRGDAAPQRPASDAVEDFAAYVYMRDNPAGPIEEYWFHAMGCRSWLVAQRDTRTHVISSMRLAGGLV